MPTRRAHDLTLCLQRVCEQSANMLSAPMLKSNPAAPSVRAGTLKSLMSSLKFSLANAETHLKHVLRKPTTSDRGATAAELSGTAEIIRWQALGRAELEQLEAAARLLGGDD